MNGWRVGCVDETDAVVTALRLAEGTARRIALSAGWSEAEDQMTPIGLAALAVAWGGTDRRLSPDDLDAMAAPLARRRGVTLDLAGLDPQPAPALIGRILLNLILLGVDSLPQGGRVRLVGDAASGVVTAIDGPSARWVGGLAAGIADPASVLTSVAGDIASHATWTVALAYRAGLRLALLMNLDTAPPLLLSQQVDAAADDDPA